MPTLALKFLFKFMFEYFLFKYQRGQPWGAAWGVKFNSNSFSTKCHSLSLAGLYYKRKKLMAHVNKPKPAQRSETKNSSAKWPGGHKSNAESKQEVPNSPRRGCPGVPVHGGIPIVFVSIHGVVTQLVNVSFLCVPVHEETTARVHINLGTRPLKTSQVTLPPF